jgi:pimeloyl-ACP methyl ester carboxylesterase
MTTISIAVEGGLNIAADELGPAGAPTVILGHGGGQTRHSWDKAGVELAAAGYHVLNYDLLGHGDSDWNPSGDYSIMRRVADLRAIAGMSHPTYALVGASLGGISALAAAASGLEPAAIVLVDVVPAMAPEGVERIVGFMTANPDGFATLEEAGDAISAYKGGERPKNLDGLRKNLREGDDGRFRWHWDPNFLTGTRNHTHILDILEEAHWIDTIPTLLVRGLQSDVVTDEGIADLRRRIPALEVADIGGAGHMVAGDRNDQFNEAVIEFLSRVMPTATTIQA